MTHNKRERIVLFVVLCILVALNVIGYYKQMRWKRQYSMIIEHVTSQLSVNCATKIELESLPGIGPSLAQRIIEYREEHGKFLCLEELKCVKGIGEKKYATILPFVKL